MGTKKVFRLPIVDVNIGDKIYMDFPDDLGGIKKGYVPIVNKLDMGVGGIFLGAEYDTQKEPVYVKVGNNIVTVVRDMS